MTDPDLWAMPADVSRCKPSWPATAPHLFDSGSAAATTSYPLCALVVLPDDDGRRFYGVLVCRPLVARRVIMRHCVVASADVTRGGHIFLPDPFDFGRNYRNLWCLADTLSPPGARCSLSDLCRTTEALVRLACNAVACGLAPTLGTMPVLGRDLSGQLDVNVIQRHVPLDGPSLYTVFLSARDIVMLSTKVLPARQRLYDWMTASTLENCAAQSLADRLVDHGDADKLACIPMHLRCLVVTHALSQACTSNRLDPLCAIARLLDVDPTNKSPVALAVTLALAVGALLPHPNKGLAAVLRQRPVLSVFLCRPRFLNCIFLDFY
ncbi:hypothetical protein TW95_gp0380 [Pandoravirus inopinatum]|uniref:Uncharacterized protein n=1 Tax=Pandoravirus inopinatum TaxID=1605721 RepID=A0A0B5J0W6_9VIRU|nr:hypothetical protein TW95_gp0380 [Pandoravirus inopinatum]AJF97114.1 hypothetical protein [Pandoravirus inopinatum]